MVLAGTAQDTSLQIISHVKSKIQIKTIQIVGRKIVDAHTQQNSVVQEKRDRDIHSDRLGENHISFWLTIDQRVWNCCISTYNWTAIFDICLGSTHNRIWKVFPIARNRRGWKVVCICTYKRNVLYIAHRYDPEGSHAMNTHTHMWNATISISVFTEFSFRLGYESESCNTVTYERERKFDHH